MAGAAAAMRLHELGHTDMVIIEGSGRVGGRLYGVKFGNFTLEQGALWIHGLGSNPIYLLAKAHKLEATPTDYDDFTIRDENGHDLTSSSKNISIHFKIAIDRAKRLSDKLKRENHQDISWRQGLQMSGWTPKTPVHDAIEYFRRDFEYLFTPEATSLKYGIADTYDIHGDDNDVAVTDSKGYAYIVQAELKKVIEKSKSKLLLNKFVTNINQRNNKVIVSFKHGDALTFDYVILTFGIGVLQGRVVNFDPPLPESKVDKINQVLNGAYYEVFLEFPETFWDETQFILYASKRRGYFTVWQNINKLYPNSNILHVTTTESEAKRMDRISDEELKLELMQILRNMYGKSGKRIPDPIKFQTHRWMLDPLFMGSFSINQPGYTAETCHKICEPFHHVYFAGETCSFNFSGFVQGAWYSGKDAAEHLHEDITLNRKHP